MEIPNETLSPTNLAKQKKCVTNSLLSISLFPGQQAAGSLGPRRSASLERRRPLERVSGSPDYAAGHAHPGPGLRATSRWPPAGGVRPQVVPGQSVPGERGQRQPPVRVEPALVQPGPVVLGAHGRGESDRVVTPPPRTARERRRYGRSLYSLLEHAHRPADAVRRHRIAGL